MRGGGCKLKEGLRLFCVFVVRLVLKRAKNDGIFGGERWRYMCILCCYVLWIAFIYSEISEFIK